MDQDALAQKDILFSEANIRVDTLTDDFRNSNLPTTEAKVLSLFFDYRMTGYKIAKELGISINHAYRIIRKFKAILLKNIKN